MTKPVVTKEAFWTGEFSVERDEKRVTIWFYVGDVSVTGIGLECTQIYNSIHAAKTIYGRCKKDKEFTHKMYFDFLAEEFEDNDAI